MKASRWRRWALRIYVGMLTLWVLALVVSFLAFGGPSSPLAWIQFGVVTLMLVVLIVGELRARAEAS